MPHNTGRKKGGKPSEAKGENTEMGNEKDWRENGYTRTDLACEATGFRGKHSREILRLGGDESVTLQRSRSEDGRRYVTLSCGRLTTRAARELDELADVVCDELVSMTEALLGRSPHGGMRVLAVGLGNADMTADAIGPGTVRRLTATRHLRGYDGEMYRALGCCELSAVAPGVLGQTGIEALELVKGAVAHVKPHLVVAVDALAARSCDRLASTIQLSDGGIGPGSGVGNHRRALDRETLGCPVVALGVPTVVDSATLVYDALGQAGIHDDHMGDELKKVLENGRSFVVSPRDSDRITELTCVLLAKAIDRAFGVGEI